MNRLGLALLACGAGFLAMWNCVSPIAAATEPVVIKLTSRHDSGVSAKATLKADGDATIVTVSISGNGAFLPDIRSGTCDSAATTPEIPLAIGTKSQPSVTTVDVPAARLLKGRGVLMLHRADATLSGLEPSSAVACGELTLAQPVISVGPVTGVGPIAAPGGTGASIAALGVAAVGLLVSAWVLAHRGARP